MSDDKDTNCVLNQLNLTVSALQTACTFDSGCSLHEGHILCPQSPTGVYGT